MSKSRPSGPPFRVGMIGSAQDQLYDILRLTAEAESGRLAEGAMLRVWQRLIRDARDYGEPLYNLYGMRVQVRRACDPPLYVEWGVHFTEDFALIRRVVLLQAPDEA